LAHEKNIPINQSIAFEHAIDKENIMILEIIRYYKKNQNISLH